MIQAATRLWHQLVHPDEMDHRVRAALVASLYQSPLSLALGALVGLLTSLYAGYAADSPTIEAIAKLVAIIAVLRIAAQFGLAPYADRRDDRSRWYEYIYETGAWTYSLMLGLLAATSIAQRIDPHVTVITVTSAVGYGAAIAARNAGRPVIAIGQTLFATLPVSIALLLSDSPAFRVLSVATAVYMIAMIGITLRTFAIIRDSFARAQVQADLAREMQAYATTDAVTRLLNRAGLNAMLDRKAWRAEAGTLSVFWLDLDRFKEVNDTLGHPVGDRLLMSVADRLRALCGPNDVVSRFGGDEFIVLRSGLDTDTAHQFAGALLTAIAQPVMVDDHVINATASLGIAMAPVDGSDGEALMKRADMALYHSKLNGRNTFSFYQADMTFALTRRKQIENELREALGKGELAVHYQPIIDFSTGRIAAFEALVRWHHPERGPLSPEEFIPIAEHTGLIITIGNWVAVEACKAAATWPGDIPVCVNLSPLQMRAPGAALGILNALRGARIPGRKLELELTESVFLEPGEDIRDFIRVVEDAGVRLTLDDFGTGYSSLAYLHHYNFSKIKIDRSFVSGKDSDSKSMAIVRAVAGLARELDMRVIAEGVESEAEADRVRAAGCTHGQGYHYAPALPADQALAMATAGTRANDGSRVA